MFTTEAQNGDNWALSACTTNDSKGGSSPNGCCKNNDEKRDGCCMLQFNENTTNGGK